MNELRALTSARGVAAWLVVLFHVRSVFAGLPPAVGLILGRGYLAVDFFFLLSGLLMGLRWHARLRRGGLPAIVEFLRKRFARIWPLHAVMLGLALCLALALRATGRDDPAFPLAQWPLHLLLLQDWGADALAWNAPAWSISSESAAYLLFPILAMLVDWRRWPSLALVATIAALVVGLHLVMAPLPSLGADVARFGMVRCQAEFASGTILAALFVRRPPLAIPLAVTGLAAAAWMLGAPETLAAPVVFAGLLLVLALTAGRPGNPIEGRTLHYIGEISFATYLSHFLLWKVFKLVLVRDGGAVSPALIALYLLLVLAASVILYHGVERPAQRWINHRPARHPQPAPAV